MPKKPSKNIKKNKPTKKYKRITRSVTVKKNNRIPVILPPLRKIDDSKKKHKYRIKDPSHMRQKAIDEGVMMEKMGNKNKKMTRKQAAVAKKAQFNVLRIYRRNNYKDQCKLITKDMRYIDKKYGLKKTNDIC